MVMWKMKAPTLPPPEFVNTEEICAELAHALPPHLCSLITVWAAWLIG